MLDIKIALLIITCVPDISQFSGDVHKVSPPDIDVKMSVEYILREISLRNVPALWSRSPNIDGQRGPCTGPVRSIMPRTAARAFYSRIMGIEYPSLWRIIRWVLSNECVVFCRVNGGHQGVPCIEIPAFSVMKIESSGHFLTRMERKQHGIN